MLDDTVMPGKADFLPPPSLPTLGVTLAWLHEALVNAQI